MFRKSTVNVLLTLCLASAALVPAPKCENKATPPDIIIIKGSPLGAVRFPHKLHAETYAEGKCETCHHPSKPEKPAAAPQQACRDCHTKPPQPGMKTGTQGAFHSPTAKSGTCIDCHLKMNAAGKKAPTMCMQCHKKENA